jgi:hypothetical protein
MIPDHWEVWAPTDDGHDVLILGDFSDRHEALERLRTALDDGASSVTIVVAGVIRSAGDASP